MINTLNLVHISYDKDKRRGLIMCLPSIPLHLQSLRKLHESLVQGEPRERTKTVLRYSVSV